MKAVTSGFKNAIKQLGREILPYAEKLGLGTRNYELINID